MSTKPLKKTENCRGIIAFAANTSDVDYVSIAQKTLKVAEKTLNLPTTLIELNANGLHNSRFDIDLNKFTEWKNFNRCLAYELSPYEETIVIDADYLILDKNLNKIFDCQWDYLLQRNSHAISVNWPKQMGQNSLPYVWATVFAFRKTTKSKLFFELVQRIQNNYSYYRLLFNVQERNYRNDYAFSIADIILNGYKVNNHGIPGSMLAVDMPIESIETQNNSLIIRESKSAHIVPRTNIHIMSKKYLQSKNFDNLINELA